MPLHIKVGFELSLRVGAVPLRPRGTATFVVKVLDSKVVVDVEEIILENWYQGILSMVKDYLKENLSSRLTTAINKALQDLPKRDRRITELHIITGE